MTSLPALKNVDLPIVPRNVAVASITETAPTSISGLSNICTSNRVSVKIERELVLCVKVQM